MDALGAGNLQSGFVLAVILAAVLFVERIGGSEALAQRALQVAVGTLIAFTVVSGTTAFLRQPHIPSELRADGSGTSRDSDQAQLDYITDVNNRNQNANTIHAGVGALLAIAGIAALRRWRVVPLGWLLGGVLLVLFGGAGSRVATDTPSLLLASYSTLLGSYLGTSDRLADVVHFVVVLAGALALSLFGFLQWELRPRPAAPAPETEA